MKKNILNGITVCVVALLIPMSIQAQGTVYLSNLAQPSASSVVVGSNLWTASAFKTGANVGGYALNSIQLEMMNASGNPDAFTLLLYSALKYSAESIPGSNIDTLDGSTAPMAGGIYTYVSNTNFILAPSTVYFIVLTAGTATNNGAYNLSVANTYSYNPTGGRLAPSGVTGADIYQSANGISWNLTPSIYGQYAINATAIPEPGVLSLLGLGGLAFLWQRRRLGN